MHEDRGELHGITVVVDTVDESTFVGRFFEATDQGVLLMDADRFDPTEDGATRDDFLSRAARFGQWARIKRVVVPTEKVLEVTRLADHSG